MSLFSSHNTTHQYVIHKQRPVLSHVAASLVALFALGQPMLAYAAGDSELIAMPTGRLELEGVWRTDFSFVKPYPIVRSQVAILPWLQGGFGVVRIMGVAGFVAGVSDDKFVQNYGDYKDKTIFGRIKISDESEWMPATAFVLQDPIGTSLFKSTAIAASKRFAIGKMPVDATVGYGTGRIKGAFGGVKATISGDLGLKMVLEKDANNYKNDLYADKTGLININQPIAYGLEYQPSGSSWGLRVARRTGTTEVQMHYVTDANIRDSMPKAKENPRFRAPLIQPTAAQWRSNPAYLQAMRSVLHSYGFEQVNIEYTQNNRLMLTLAHTSQLHASAAVGDAIHIALKTTPSETQEISLRYLNDETKLPIVEYSFTDLKALQRYLTGQSLQADVLPSVKLNDPYIDKSGRLDTTDLAIAQRNNSEQATLSHSLSQAQVAAQRSIALDTQISSEYNLAGVTTAPLGGYNLLQLGLQPRNEESQLNITPLGLTWNSGGERDYRASIAPRLSTYLNGPGGLQYALKVAAQADAKLVDKTYASVAVSQTINENISKLGIALPNSTQPEVRSRSAFYEIGKQFKLDVAIVNNFQHIDQNLYARMGAGMYERAYAGVGGQLLYAPSDTAWAADVSVDALAQRHETQMFGLNGYRTLTALAALHYRLPMELGITLRAGRFLAKDAGVRMEFKRRFWGGMEVGGWASITNAKDYGVGSGNYRDKGLLITIPFDGMLPTYNRDKVHIALSPWTRDIAQMVNNPADLYTLLEDDLRSKQVQGGLERFAGVADYDGRVRMGALAIDEGILPPLQRAVQSFGVGVKQANWGEMLATGAIFTVGAALSDNGINRATTRGLAAQRRFKQLDDVTTGLAVLGLGTSALWAYDGMNWERSHIALSSLEASGTAVLMATGLKYLTARARPDADLGSTSFGAVSRGDSSFPSRHVAMAAALVTPYAMHYDAPVLYTLPVLTALARVGTRKHWFSDVAVGGALGYVLGNVFYSAHANKVSSQRSPTLFNVTKDSLTIIIPTK